MRYSLRQVLALMVFVALWVQGVQAFVDRQEVRRLESQLVQESRVFRAAQRNSPSRRKQTEVCTDVSREFQNPLDYRTIKQRYRQLQRSEGSE